jgi:hypothetical protein
MSARAAGPDTEEVASPSRLLLGRDRELATLYRLVEKIEEQGGALVVRGEAGIGKSALLAAAQERALHGGVTVVSTTGALSEAQLAFAGLQQLLLPLLGGLALLPHPQRRALEAAFGHEEKRSLGCPLCDEPQRREADQEKVGSVALGDPSVWRYRRMS